MILQIAAAVLVAASFVDGLSTRYFLKAGAGYAYERNPLFGKHPSTAKIFGLGMTIVAGEIITAMVVSHYHPKLSGLFAILAFGQSAVHAYEAYRNYKDF